MPSRSMVGGYRESHIEGYMNRISNKEWKTKYDDILLISEMSTSHIKNTVGMLGRYPWKHGQMDYIVDKYVKIFNSELHSRGEIVFLYTNI